MVRLLAHCRYDVFEQAAAEEEAVFVALQFERGGRRRAWPLPRRRDRHRSAPCRDAGGDERPQFRLRVGAGTTFSARTRSPAQGFGYAVMNLGLGSADSIIHTEMMQGFRPSGVTSEQLTSNF